VDAADGADLDAVVAADAAVAVAVVSARAAEHAIFLHPNTLRHKASLAAVTVARIVVETAVEIAEAVVAIRIVAAATIVARGVTSTIAVPTLRVRPRHPIPRKNRLYCRANRSRNIAGVRYRKQLRLLRLPSRNASNRRLNRKKRSRAFPASRLRQTLRVVREADCPAGSSLALPRKALKQRNRTSPLRKIFRMKSVATYPPKLMKTKKLRGAANLPKRKPLQKWTSAKKKPSCFPPTSSKPSRIWFARK